MTGASTAAGAPGARDAGRLSLSSMWFQRFENPLDLEPFFEAGRRMGFRRFELSHGHPAEALATVDPRRVDIAAVHHPCPRLPDHAETDSLIASDPAARRRASDAFLATLETAARLEAEAVVAHLGKVEDDRAQTCRRLRFELEARQRAGQRETPIYARAQHRLEAWLAAQEPACLARALEALPPLLDRAAALGIRLGLESGYHAHELPTVKGMAHLLAALEAQSYGPDRIGAWLDTGHVGARAHLGLDGLEAWLGAIDGAWIGVHLHDLVGLRDHLVPGMGDIDFAGLADRLPAGIVSTCELDWYFEPAEIEAGIAVLQAAGWH